MEVTEASQPDPAATVRLYSVPTVATILDVTERFVWTLIREGKLHRVRIGARSLIRDDELARLIDEATERGTPA